MADQLERTRQAVAAWETGGGLTAYQLADVCLLYGCSSDAILFGLPPDKTSQGAAAEALRLAAS